MAALGYLKQTPTDGIVKAIYGAMYGDEPELREAAFLTLWEIGSSGYKLPTSNSISDLADADHKRHDRHWEMPKTRVSS